MNSFDDALERLLTDPAFASALAADPATALAGYRLTDEEHALLRSQLTPDAGGQTAVEARTNQSSLFGMLAPLAGIAGGIGASIAPPVPEGGSGLVGPGLTGPALGDILNNPDPDWGTGAGGAGVGGGLGPGESPTPPGTAGFGAAQPPGEAAGTAGFGAAPPASDAIGQPLHRPPSGYHIRVDVDGDGDWDRHTLRGRADGGVDVLVDADRDGRIDFVGHDDDADGLVESADYDKDGDGFFEKTMYDDTGDGWLDRTVRHRPPPEGIGDALGPAR